MTSDQRFERDLPSLLAQLAPLATPDYRDDVVGLTARMRQRPAWRFPERWLPVDITLAPPRGRPRSLAALVLLVIVGLLVAGLLVAYVGSRPAPLPAPFGPAVNGSLFFASDGGEILTIDSPTATPRTLIKGSDSYEYPLPSRDGRSIEFGHTADGVSTIYVADVDGSNIHPLAGTYADWSETDWSPDGRQLAVVSATGGHRVLTVLEADGSAAHSLPLDVDVQNFWYLPDGRFVFKGSAASTGGTAYALYTVNADGTGLKPITPTSTDEGTWLGISPSADGSTLLYHHWDPAAGEPGRLYLMDIATGVHHPVPVTYTGDENHEDAQLSPDGQRILFNRFTACCLRLSVVPIAGGTPRDIGPTLHENTEPSASFSPDGEWVIAYYATAKELWLLDPTGVQPDQRLELGSTDAPLWQRKGS